MLECILGPEIDDLFRQFNQLFVIFFGFKLLERNQNRAHQVADLQRTLSADENRHALVIAGMQRLGHNIQAVHAAHAVLVVNSQGVVIIQRHCLGRAA